MIKIIAQAKATLPPLQGLGPLGNEKEELSNSFTAAVTQFNKTISTSIGVLTVSAGIWFIIQIFAGSYQWLASGGEKDGVQKAQKRITHSVVGLFTVVASYLLISIIGRIFGLDILQPFNSLTGVSTSP